MTPITPMERVVDNLYLTFSYAQGLRHLDEIFAQLLVHEYQQWPKESRASLAELGEPGREPLFDALRGLPEGHAKLRGAGPSVKEQYDERWDLLGKLYREQELTEEERHGLLVKLEDSLVLRDDEFNSPPLDASEAEDEPIRKRRFLVDGDPHGSVYRTYVMQGRGTGSPEFETIFNDLRARYLSGHRSPYYEILVQSWSATHPGEVFEPPSQDDAAQHALGDLAAGAEVRRPESA